MRQPVEGVSGGPRTRSQAASTMSHVRASAAKNASQNETLPLIGSTRASRAPQVNVKGKNAGSQVRQRQTSAGVKVEVAVEEEEDVELKSNLRASSCVEGADGSVPKPKSRAGRGGRSLKGEGVVQGDDGVGIQSMLTGCQKAGEQAGDVKAASSKGVRKKVEEGAKKLGSSRSRPRPPCAQEAEDQAPAIATTPTPAKRSRLDNAATESPFQQPGRKTGNETATAMAVSGGPRPAGHPLINLGVLVHGIVIKRPSGSIRSPYVADVLLEDGRTVLAHSPALDCAGMIVPGKKVYLSVSATKAAPTKPGAEEKLKTSHAVQLVVEDREEGASAVVGAHPMRAEQMAKQLIERKEIPEFGNDFTLSSQKTFGNCRVDFVLEYTDGSRLLVEVKNVVGADYPEGRVPEGRSKVGVYETDETPYQRTAIFPHGSKKPGVKVVSDRAIKHVDHLMHVQQASTGDLSRTRAAVLFLVNRSDCCSFRPCDEACPLFASVLKKAQESGVMVLAYDVTWQVEEGQAYLGRALPVRYRQQVRSEVDAGWLARVLEFNQTSPKR